MKIQFKTALLFLCSCNLIEPPTHTSPELDYYVERVLFEAEIRGVKVDPIKIVLGDLKGDKSGTYKSFPYWDRKIIIDREYFMESSEEVILKTVAHEIGHSMGRGHTNKEENGIPISIMCQGCWIDLEENSEYYFDELFK